MLLPEEKINWLEEKAAEIRRDAIQSVITARSGHVAGPLDMADIFAVLYFHTLRHNPKYPAWEGRDRLVLSNGHICPVLYAALANAGYFPKSELQKLRKFNSPLQGHPDRKFLPALETSSGPLGSGLSQAVGMAVGFKMDDKANQVFCLMSDAEQQCGNTWEGAMLAGKLKLDNLTAVIDRNNIQIDGMTENVMPLEPLAAKYRAFNWHVLEINGHNIGEIINGFETARAIVEKPVVIIAHTIAGKGVSFMEGKYEWHSKTFTAEEAEMTMKELSKKPEPAVPAGEVCRKKVF